MPRDISSSSEDETDNTAESHAQQRESAASHHGEYVTEDKHKHKQGEKSTGYQCPADFLPSCHEPCSSTLTESLKNSKNELWLVRAPASFNPECFSGIQVPLSGLQTLKVPAAAGTSNTAGGEQIYSILASTHGTSELCLLTSNKQSSDGMVFGPTFSGLLNVCESYGDNGANQAPQVIPAAPAPSIPPGLKQRFHPFGSKTPTLTCVAETEADGAAFGPSSTTFRPLVVKRLIEETWQEEEEEEEEGGQGRKKKKTKKKEKQIKAKKGEEVEKLVSVKEEAVAVSLDEVRVALPFQEADVAEEKRKKKKKKKDREREEVEPSVRVKEEVVTVKCESIDTTYGDALEGSGKKKKKKKKKKIKAGDD